MLAGKLFRTEYEGKKTQLEINLELTLMKTHFEILQYLQINYSNSYSSHQTNIHKHNCTKINHLQSALGSYLHTIMIWSHSISDQTKWNWKLFQNIHFHMWISLDRQNNELYIRNLCYENVIITALHSLILFISLPQFLNYP